MGKGFRLKMLIFAQNFYMDTLYKNVKNDRQMRSTTGLSRDLFNKLLLYFIVAYRSVEGKILEEKMADNVQTFVFQRYEDMLYLVLFYLKSGISTDILGVIYSKDGGQMKRFVDKYSVILLEALSIQDCLPRRCFASVAEFKRFLADNKDLVIDATEVPVERPLDIEKQKKVYSGKKKDIALKIR